ncbi:MAG: P1 family peptidase [Candidatus Bathyarchaeota archaeon]|nr:MAG: P1 family peptidase [Candidatus Bathyarchaeota archaeon]
MGKRVRAREFGIEMGLLETGRLNAITDVEGVGVGHSTLIEGDNIRTGVTAIVPHQGNPFEEKVTAAVDIFNAYGKSTGLPQIQFEGVIEVPILLTETLNTWRVANSVLDYMNEGYGLVPRSLNVVVGETNGSYLTDNFGRHVGKEQVFEAIDKARTPEGRGPVPEGNVGGGTPMTGYGFKGGIGTASRKYANFTVGILVQLNCGAKDELRIDGVPVGREIELPRPPERSPGNSIMMICATDLDIESRQLWKVAKRVALGLARTGSYSGNGSGDFTIAFTTGKKKVDELREMAQARRRSFSGDSFLSLVYRATVEATEEAIINALFKAETLTGREGNTRYELPYDQVAEVLERQGRSLRK